MVAPLLLGLGGGIAIGTQFAPQIKAGASNVLTQIKGTTGATDRPVESDEQPKIELQGPSKDTFSGSKKSSETEGETASANQTGATNGSSASADSSSTKTSESSSLNPLEDASATVDKIIGSDSKSSSTIPT